LDFTIEQSVSESVSPTKKKKRRRSKKEAKMRMQAKQLLKKKNYLSLSLFLHTPLELHHTSFLSFFCEQSLFVQNQLNVFPFFLGSKKNSFFKGKIIQYEASCIIYKLTTPYDQNRELIEQPSLPTY